MLLPARFRSLPLATSGFGGRGGEDLCPVLSAVRMFRAPSVAMAVEESEVQLLVTYKVPVKCRQSFAKNRRKQFSCIIEPLSKEADVNVPRSRIRKQSTTPQTNDFVLARSPARCLAITAATTSGRLHRAALRLDFAPMHSRWFRS